MAVIVVGEFMLDFVLDWSWPIKLGLLAGGAGTVVRAVRCAGGTVVGCVGWVKPGTGVTVLAHLLGATRTDLSASSRREGSLRLRFHLMGAKKQSFCLRWDAVGPQLNEEVIEAKLRQGVMRIRQGDLLVVSDFGKVRHSGLFLSGAQAIWPYRLALIGSKSSLYSGVPRSL